MICSAFASERHKMPLTNLHGDAHIEQYTATQLWSPDYRELDRNVLRSQQELNEITRDVGLQLGKGHCSHVTAPLEDQHRFAQHQSISQYYNKMIEVARDLAERMVSAWIFERERL